MTEDANGHPSYDESSIRSYYDEFAARYERKRRPADPRGYHALIDDLEIDFTLRYARGRDLLEVGCGTGLILQRLVDHCRSAQGVDLSPGMLQLARQRGLEVCEGSATSLPYDDARFDVVCSFKVLAHVPQLKEALEEMLRVVRPGGFVLAEVYNPRSLRALAKTYGPAQPISDTTKENAVYTRFDSPENVAQLLPPYARIVDSRGVRIVTPFARAMQVPVLRGALRQAEWALCDSPLSVFGGFWIAAIQKDA